MTKVRGHLEEEQVNADKGIIAAVIVWLIGALLTVSQKYEVTERRNK